VSLRLAASPSTQSTSSDQGVESVDFPRSCDGLSGYYTLVATTTDAVAHAGGRWFFAPFARCRVLLVCCTKLQYRCTIGNEFCVTMRRAACALACVHVRWGVGVRTPTLALTLDSTL
jgi:hypothetical protein